MAVIPLGFVPPHHRLAVWAAAELIRVSGPVVRDLLADPSGVIGRLGDLIVWNGPTSQHILGGLEATVESQARIESAIGRVESAQLALTHGLAGLSHLAMASMGLAALGTGFLVLRLKALDRRLTTLGSQVADILAGQSAEHKTLLQSTLDHLTKFEVEGTTDNLKNAEDLGFQATNLYRNLVGHELGGPRRLVALNQCGRYYVLALTALARSLILAGSLKMAERQLEAERASLAALAQALFDEVLGRTPEVFLDPRFQPDGVTLDLLAEVYRQARLAGVVMPATFDGAGGTFEYLRPRVAAARIPAIRLFRPVGPAKERLLTGLRYLAACLEDVNRLHALRLRVADALAGGTSLADLQCEVATARANAMAGIGGGDGLFAYAFDRAAAAPKPAAPTVTNG